MEPAVQIARRQVQVGAAVVHYDTAGSGAPLILLHGLSGSSRWWARNVDVLARHFRVYAVNFLGYGRRRRRERFVLGQAADRLLAWMDQLHIAQASLIGHSMGGRIAAALAADFPARVARLVLVNAPILPFEHVALRQSWRVVRALPHLPRSLLPLLLRDAARTGVRQTLQVGYELLTTDLRHKLAAIQAPTLVIWGEHDTIVPLAIGQQLAAHLAQSRLVVMRATGHVPMWEHPDTFNRLVLEFLSAGPAPESDSTSERL